MPVTIGNLRERLSQVAALIEAAQLAANGLPQDQSAPMRTLLQFAADKFTGGFALGGKITKCSTSLVTPVIIAASGSSSVPVG